MKHWKYIWCVTVFVLGSYVLFLIQESQSPKPSMHVDVTEQSFTISDICRDGINTTPRTDRFSSMTMPEKNFTTFYIRSVFCNKKLKSVPFSAVNHELAPDRDVLSGKDLIILVISSPVHSDLREAIRQTWANTSHTGVAVIFVLGLHWENYWNTVITEEHDQYGDILQLITPDTYRNLPEKILMAFQWLMKSFPRIKYVMKSDDDVYLHLPNVVSLVKNLSINVIVGAYNPHSIVSRNTKDDWGVSKNIYLLDYFPPYVSGGSYLMSAHVTRRILQSLSTCHRLHIEDVFITGVLALSARITHQPHDGFSFWGTPKAQPCDMRNGRVNSVNMGEKQIYNLHKQILSKNQKTSNYMCNAK